jgi:hypothetical protein
MTRRNDIEFARENRAFFVDLPPDDELGDIWEKYCRAVAAVQFHAQKVAGRRIPPLVFDPSALEPLLELPVINFKRVGVPLDITVPDLVGRSLEKAKDELELVGLTHETTFVSIEDKPWWIPGNFGAEPVIAQIPTLGTTVPLGYPVRLTVNKYYLEFAAR